MAIKACLFDMGNVLVHFCHGRMCENVSAVANVPVEEARRILLNEGLQWRIERGLISESEFHAQFEQHAGKSVDRSEFLTATADIFELNESMPKLLDELKSLGLKLVLLSNTSVNHLNFIESKFDILNAFDDRTTSFHVGELKPHESIYEDAIRRAGCLPHECFYTDDIVAYVEKGRQLGLNAHVFTQTHLAREALNELGVAVQSS